MTSDKLPNSLSSISVPRKQSPVTTDYIITRVEIGGPEFRLFAFYGADRYKNLASKCVDMDKACNNYYSGTGKIFVMNCSDL